MRALITLAMLVAVASPGCFGGGGVGGQACTQIGCQDGLVIELATPGSWPAGAYRFELAADGVTTTCVATLPLASCDQAQVSCQPFVAGIAIVESGCALPPGSHSFPLIELDGTPATVTVEVFHDQQPIGATTFTPTYQTSQPNGPGCEPICTNARATLPLAFD